MVTEVPSGGLTSVEQSLVEHVGRGEWLDLTADDEAVDDAAMRSRDDSRTCRASVIRDILRGRLVADPDPHGLRLRGARIIGRLDLEDLTTDVSLELADCLLKEGVLARGARLAEFGLTRCQLEHPAEPPLDGDHLICRALSLAGARVIGHASMGAVRLASARVGQLGCIGAKLSNDAGPALSADGLQVDHGLFLRDGFTATGSGDRGAVRLLGAHIGGQLDCIGAQMRNDSGPALTADSLRVDQRMLLRDGFTATGSGARGAVNLSGAYIGGSLECDGAQLRNDSGPALYADGLEIGQDMQCDRLTAAGGVVLGGHICRLLSFEGAVLNNRGGIALLSDGLRVDGTMFCRKGFTAQGEVRLPGARIGGRLYFDGARLSNPGGRAFVASRLTVGQDVFCRKREFQGHEQPFRVEGAVDLVGAHIGGNLDCTEANLRNDSGPALHADGLQVDQGVYLTGEFTGSRDDGAVNLAGAHIGGSLVCDGAPLSNDSGPALYAGLLQVGQIMYLSGEFTGSGDDGAVNLAGAHIGGQLNCPGADLRNGSGPALSADRLRVDQGMYLTSGFAATGSGDDGAVRLGGSYIGGRFACRGVQLRNDSGPALYADGLQVDRSMFLADGFTAIGGGRDVAVDLTTARLGGKFQFAPARLENKTDSHRRLAVDGLTYADVPETGPDWDWRKLLRHGTPRYAAQPYQQLAAGYRALGDDRQARETLIAQRDDQLARTNPRWPEKLWGWITKVTLGYGYKPWRALWFLAAVVTVSCVLAVVLGAHGALTQTSKTAASGRSCTVVQQISVGLDLNLPVGTSLARAACDLTKESASVTAAWLTGAGWVLRLLAWLFAALFIAGFTSAVRKT